MTGLEDRLVLVSGAHRGIGAACARAFAAAGARVACADIRKPEATLASLQPRGNGSGHAALVGDVADAASVAAMFEELAGDLVDSTSSCIAPVSSTRRPCWRPMSTPSTG